MNLWKMSETKLNTLLENSRASDALKSAVQDFADGKESQLIMLKSEWIRRFLYPKIV